MFAVSAADTRPSFIRRIIIFTHVDPCLFLYTGEEHWGGAAVHSLIVGYTVVDLTQSLRPIVYTSAITRHRAIGATTAEKLMDCLSAVCFFIDVSFGDRCKCSLGLSVQSTQFCSLLFLLYCVCVDE